MLLADDCSLAPFGVLATFLIVVVSVVTTWGVLNAMTGDCECGCECGCDCDDD